MTTYVWRNGKFVDKKTGEPMTYKDPNAICAPMVMSDIPEYRSPIDSKPITSRSHRREDLRANGCIEVPPPTKPRGFKNERYAKRHGLPLREDVKG